MSLNNGQRAQIFLKNKTLLMAVGKIIWSRDLLDIGKLAKSLFCIQVRKALKCEEGISIESKVFSE